jgi:hypothetical protein
MTKRQFPVVMLLGAVLALTSACTPNGGEDEGGGTDAGLVDGGNGGNGGSGDGGNTASRIGVPCATTTDCLAKELCHPVARVCVQTCQSGSDCPEQAKRCGPLGGTSPEAATTICQCFMNELCRFTEPNSTLVCSSTFTVCMPACGGAQACPSGYTCEQSSGQCR